jgi:CMP-2-keto-3-deoxyoctulosonic acid synthetase
MGMIGYRKEFLLHLVGLSPTPSEQHDFIEQMRILEHGYNIAGVKMDRALPSVNEPGEAKIVASQLENDPEQSQLLFDIFKE